MGVMINQFMRVTNKHTMADMQVMKVLAPGVQFIPYLEDIFKTHTLVMKVPYLIWI